VRNKPNFAGRPGSRRADCAKQTQFGLLPRGRGGPKCAKRTQFATRGAGTSGTDRAKQSQFRATGEKGKSFVERDLWSIGHPRRLGQTKPIPPRTAGARVGVIGGAGGVTKRAKRTQFPAGPCAPNKPNLPPRGHGRPSPRPAALTMPPWRQQRCKTNPIGRSELCKTNPIRHPRCRDQRDRSGETKPIARPAGRGEARGTRPWDVVQTNPICLPPRWDQRDRSRQTKPIAGGTELGGRGPWGVVQTNPIPGAVPIGRSAFPGPDVRNEANHRQSLPPRRRGMPMPHVRPTPRPIAWENSLASKAPRG
jgi:hypothetical protein